MRGTIAVALAGAFTLTAGQSGSAGQVTAPIPSGGVAPAPVPNGVPLPLASNPVVVPQDVSPDAPSGAPSGVTVRIMRANGGRVTTMVIGPNGPEPVQLVIGPNGAPVIQHASGLVPVAEIIGPNGQLFEASDAPVATSASVVPAPVDPEPVLSGETGDLPASEEVLEQEGYYHSGAGIVKITAAAFALAIGIIGALLIQPTIEFCPNGLS